MNQQLTIGYSPCPNDTYIFYALVHGKVRVPGITFRERLEDVETLNQLALNGTLDLTKISYHALGHLRDRYALLRSGGALGRGCGPIIVTRPGVALEDLRTGTIAIPGRLTTAWLLLRIYDPSLTNIVVMPFDRILQSVTDGNVTAGLIIHESRFTYPLYKLEQFLDLGQWWERYSGLPIPLGGILGLRSLGADTLLKVDEGLRESIRYARANEQEVLAYCRQHSQEMDETVMRQHIGLYVNEYSLDLGATGTAAVKRLFEEAEQRGIFPHSASPLFAEA